MDVTIIIGTAVAAVLLLLEGVRRVALRLQSIQRELKANTTETVAAKDAATTAAQQIDAVQQLTACRLELDIARRQLSLMQALPGCLQCRMEIERIIAKAPVNRRGLDRVNNE